MLHQTSGRLYTYSLSVPYLLVFWENVLGRVERSQRLGSLVQLGVDIGSLGHDTLKPRTQIVLSNTSINQTKEKKRRRMVGRGEDHISLGRAPDNTSKQRKPFQYPRYLLEQLLG